MKISFEIELAVKEVIEMLNAPKEMSKNNCKQNNIDNEVSKGNYKQNNSINIDKLEDYVHNNNFNKVKYMLKNKMVDINTDIQNGWTVLMTAVVDGNLSMARLLIKYGANVNAKTREGRTALVHARNLHYSNMEKMLIKAGAKE